ncbi:MAG: tRNA pseudouridine(54/55) synthase Pus10 [Candidatus Bathyarchaeota archaeon]|nr:MAG: tRNA pseudouridine(54/55) synthase Pus10 [Candidatus Bathyarchaeota archaeon]
MSAAKQAAKRGKFMGMLEKAQKMLEKYSICDHCLGRQFALLGYGLGNQRRGKALKLLLTMKGHQMALTGEKKGVSLLKILTVNTSLDMATKILKRLKKRARKRRECHLCHDKFESLNELVDHSLKKLKNYEYTTFLVGVELPTETEEKEDEFKAEFEVKHGESMQNHFSREIGKRISETTQKPVDYKRPNVVVLVNPFTGRVKLKANPLYIAGRYRKLTRSIPQSKWICRECGGRGCPRCNGTGKMYQESVEEIIAKPTLEKTAGEEASFHAAGREDVDARMLGRGRPFVIEVKKPKKRFIDLQNLAETINKQAQGKVKVLNLRFGDRDTVRKLKKPEMGEKVYKAIIKFDRNVSDEELATLEKTLISTMVRQQTPLRVLHRRADRIREKYIYEAKIKRLTPNRVEMKVHCQGGLYIKELITGDQGRTNPNVSDIVSAKAETLELDVLNVITRGS